MINGLHSLMYEQTGKQVDLCIWWLSQGCLS